MSVLGHKGGAGAFHLADGLGALASGHGDGGELRFGEGSVAGGFDELPPRDRLLLAQGQVVPFVGGEAAPDDDADAVDL
jgi:hypothetical protein